MGYSRKYFLACCRRGLLKIFCFHRFLFEICGGTYLHSDVGKHYIYAFLDWREAPGRTVGVTVLLAVIVPAVFYYVLWFLYLLRLFLISKCTKVGSKVYERHTGGVNEEENVERNAE